MTLRSEIRAELVKNPKGMTSDDLFEACPSAEDEKKFRGNLSVLKAEGKVKIVSTTDEEKPKPIYGLGDWPEDGMIGRKKTAGKRAARLPKVQTKAPPMPAVRKPAPRNGAAQYAINETGELGIEMGEARIRLDADDFARLRIFIERTEDIWNHKGATK